MISALLLAGCVAPPAPHVAQVRTPPDAILDDIILSSEHRRQRQAAELDAWIAETYANLSPEERKLVDDRMVQIGMSIEAARCVLRARHTTYESQSARHHSIVIDVNRSSYTFVDGKLVTWSRSSR